ncbi:unnamed protein product [Victoria cruziana]
MRSSSPSDRSFGQMKSSSSSARPGGTYEYDVFLSFRGKDTGKGFTGHLYARLKDHGISAFIDSEHLSKGQDIMELMNYIQRSKIFMAILSKGYAESTWCLREVTMMVECGRLIIPVFLDVEPSAVRGEDQEGEHFAPAFTRYQNDTEMNQREVGNWRRALKEVGRKSGFHLKNDTDGDEAKQIRLILKRVLSEVNTFPYPVAEHPIGVDDHVQAVKNLCNDDSEVQFIGIQGMGGIGKTTIAKAIYNDLFLDYEASVILFQIRERFQRKKEKVQRQLIREILKNEDHVDTFEDGRRMIMNKMKSKRVLIILDDIDDREQLNALAGGRNWFGRGSLIIITTRNYKVLTDHCLCEEQIYKVPCLDSVQSSYLFKWYAFKGREQTRGCLPLLDAFLKAWGGLPLALQVIGSTLSSKRVEQWKKLLENLQVIPELDRIHKVLRVSYDGLSETQKQIFLDISCFFVGKDREKATLKWEACGYDTVETIEVLLSRSLVNIDHRGEFSMHVLIRDMGRKIVLQKGETALEEE